MGLRGQPCFDELFLEKADMLTITGWLGRPWSALDLDEKWVVARMVRARIRWRRVMSYIAVQPETLRAAFRPGTNWEKSNAPPWRYEREALLEHRQARLLFGFLMDSTKDRRHPDYSPDPGEVLSWPLAEILEPLPDPKELRKQALVARCGDDRNDENDG